MRMTRKSNTMDNNMTAIVSAIMITIGFVNGMLVATMIEKSYSEKTKHLLNKAIDRKFECDQMIDELNNQLAEEKQQKDRLVEQLRALVRNYERILPPEGPLERGTCYCDSESEDETFPNPASPDAL